MTKQYLHGVSSTATIWGHPIHTIFIAFPMAFLMAALASDLVYWGTMNPFWAQGSFWLLSAGLVTGVLAALFGLIDFMTIRRARDHIEGWLHLLVNGMVLFLALLNLLLRFGSMELAILPWGLILSAMTTGLLGLSGWFGGELIYHYKIGIIDDHDESETARSGRSTLKAPARHG